MAVDPPVISEETSTPQPPPRRHRLTIRSMMVFIILVAVGLGLVLNKKRNFDRVFAAQAQTLSWINQIFAQQSISIGESAYGVEDGFVTCGWEYEGHFTTYYGHLIVIKAEIHSGPTQYSGQVVFTAEGRTVSWPIEDIERGRKIDLKAEFPEAYP